MKYTAATYAKAFTAALSDEKAPSEASLAKNFMSLLKWTRDIKFRDKIMEVLEEAIVRAKGGRYVTIETPLPLSPYQAKQIRTIFTSKDLVKDSINPDLIAGIRIIINREIELDASMKRKLSKLFPN